MSSQAKYQVQLHKLVNKEDLPLLPQELENDFKWYQKILALEPYETKGLPSHNLVGKLTGCRALEIDWDNVCYRLVYKIYESPAPKRVLILSFAEHDPAYDKAKQRK